MKKIIPLLLWIPFSLSAQHLVTTAGAEGEGVIWNIGETITITLSDENSNILLTQGFLQPEQFRLSGMIYTQSNNINVKAYPNPVKDKLFIDTSNQPCTWTLQDSLGKTMNTGKLSGDKNEFIDTDNYTAGYYILTISTGRETTSIKMVK